MRDLALLPAEPVEEKRSFNDNTLCLDSGRGGHGMRSITLACGVLLATLASPVVGDACSDFRTALMQRERAKQAEQAAGTNTSAKADAVHDGLRANHAIRGARRDLMTWMLESDSPILRWELETALKNSEYDDRVMAQTAEWERRKRSKNPERNAPETEHRLSESDHQAIYERIRRAHYARRKPAGPGQSPIAILVLGQPGAGKSRVGERVIGQLKALGQWPVHINTDRLRPYHPSYARLVAEDAESDPLARGPGGGSTSWCDAGSAVQLDARRWKDWLLDETVRNRMHFVYETTGKSPDRISELTEKLKKAGYTIGVKAIAMTADESLQALDLRYLAMRHAEMPARYTPRSVHDAAYDGLPRTLDRLHEEAMIDELVVLRGRN